MNVENRKIKLNNMFTDIINSTRVECFQEHTVAWKRWSSMGGGCGNPIRNASEVLSQNLIVSARQLASFDVVGSAIRY